MFTVIWTQGAENDLASLWLGATDRDAITRASTEIDLALQTDPINAGRPKSKGRKSLVRSPLGVDYTVDQAQRCVYVLAVWSITAYVSRNGFHP